MSAERAIAESYHDRFSGLIFEKTGIRLPPGKRLMIEGRLKRRVIHLGLRDTEDYFAHIFDKGGLAEELPELIDLMTTNKTDFFREPAHFTLLAQRVVPERVARARPGLPVRMKFWSAASSTGAEAYTAAMVLAECARQSARFDFAILGTDISRRVLEQARRAVYRAEELAPVPMELRRRYLLSGTTPEGLPAGRIVPELRTKVRFAGLNLMDESYPVDTGLDVIFLRNVLIYFSAEDQQRVITRMVTHLCEGGYLFVGHSESMLVRDPRMHQVAPAAYRKGDAK